MLDQEEEKSSKAVKGLGYGCGILIFIVLLILVGGYFYMKGKLDKVEELDALSIELEARYGLLSSFTPSPSGKISADRIESFLLIEDSLWSEKDELENSILSLTEEIKNADEDESFLDVINIIGSGAGIIPELLNYYSKRGTLLLENNMGLGEYYYIYITAYFSYLGKNISDGPPFHIMNRDFNDGELVLTFGDENSKSLNLESSQEEVREARSNYISLRVNKLFRNYFDNLLNKDSTTSFAQNAKAEFELLKSNKLRIPWEGSPPEEIIESLLPYKYKLESSYNYLINPVELNPIEY